MSRTLTGTDLKSTLDNQILWTLKYNQHGKDIPDTKMELVLLSECALNTKRPAGANWLSAGTDNASGQLQLANTFAQGPLASVSAFVNVFSEHMGLSDESISPQVDKY